MKRTLSIFAIALFSACGTLDAPELTHIVDAAKGPFHSTGNVEVCIGTARLVPVESGGNLVGVCVRSSRTPKTCDSDASCGTEEECTCGQCEVRGCVSTSPCLGGLICTANRCAVSCTANTECHGKETCDNGACVLPCASDDDCGYGTTCDSFDKVCRAESCTTDADCGAEHQCVVEQRAGTVREPAWANVGGNDVIYLEINDGTNRAIYRGDPPSGGRLRLPNAPVTGGIGFGAPAPFFDDGHVVLFVESGDDIVLLRATDDAGSMFGPPDLAMHGPASSPSVVMFKNQTWMFYQSGDPSTIGFVSLDHSLHSSNGGEPNALIARQVVSSTWTGATHVRSPNAVVSGDLLLLYFTADGVENGPATEGSMVLAPAQNDSIGLAVTADLATFDVAPWGPVLAQRTNIETYLGERECSVLLTDSGATMLYVGSDADGTHAALSLATSP